MKNKNKFKNPTFNKVAVVSGGALVAGLLIAGAISLARIQDEGRRVSLIARQFMCICNMNCGLKLSACSCKEPQGALEKKAFIRSQLKEGKSNPEIMALFNQKYGGLIK